MQPKCNHNTTITHQREMRTVPSITLKNIPETLYLALKQRAETHHRSLNGEVISCLEEVAMPRRISREDIAEQLREMRVEIGPGVALSPAEMKAAIDEGRE
ncbi:MAG: Arc family DNA-binding protein [Halieaceae bacterium]